MKRRKHEYPDGEVEYYDCCLFRGFTQGDHELPPWEYIPEDPLVFSYTTYIFLNCLDEECGFLGMDIQSPLGYTEECFRMSRSNDNHFLNNLQKSLIVPDFNYEKINSFLKEYFDSIKGVTISEILLKAYRHTYDIDWHVTERNAEILDNRELEVFFHIKSISAWEGCFLEKNDNTFMDIHQLMKYVPQNEHDFDLLIELELIFYGNQAEKFYITLTTPARVHQRIFEYWKKSKPEIMFLYKILEMPAYEIEKSLEVIKEYVQNIRGSSKAEIILKMCQAFDNDQEYIKGKFLFSEE